MLRVRVSGVAETEEAHDQRIERREATPVRLSFERLWICMAILSNGLYALSGVFMTLGKVRRVFIRLYNDWSE